MFRVSGHRAPALPFPLAIDVRSEIVGFGSTRMNQRWSAWLGRAALAFAGGASARAMAADFNFSMSYSGQSITGRLIGIPLDANGNGTEVDPASILIFSAPAAVGLPASPTNSPFSMRRTSVGTINAKV